MLQFTKRLRIMSALNDTRAKQQQQMSISNYVTISECLTLPLHLGSQPLKRLRNTLSRTRYLPRILALNHYFRVHTNILLVPLHTKIAQRIQLLLTSSPDISFISMTIHHLTSPLRTASRTRGAPFRTRSATAIVVSQFRTLFLRYLCAPEGVHTGHVCSDDSHGEFNRRDDCYGAEDIGDVFRVGELPEHDETKERDHDCAAAECEDGD
jgi:hypothetical protein